VFYFCYPFVNLKPSPSQSESGTPDLNWAPIKSRLKPLKRRPLFQSAWLHDMPKGSLTVSK